VIGTGEPTKRLFTQGMVIKDGAKMSKSLGNVVSPDDMVTLFGADSARLYSLFAAPPDRDLDWQEEGVSGVNRFLGRLYRFVTRNADRISGGAGGDADRQALRKLHQTIQKITGDFDSRWHFNTSIASLMELVNELYALEASLSVACTAEVCKTLTLMLAPFAPYTAQDLWVALGYTGHVFRQPWPVFDPVLAKEDLVEVTVQVNGKVRGHLSVPHNSPKADLEELGQAHEKVQPFLDGKQIVKTIIVPDKLINFVVK
jgi:leucyl-tRNA synthetase